MKIVHIAPNAPYNDGWGYQDNLLPKYHLKAGHEVTFIATDTAHVNGKIEKVPCETFVSKEGVRVMRLARKEYGSRVITSLCSKMDVYPVLKQLRPDLVFFPGLLSTTVFDAIRYKIRDNPGCVFVQDNHMDYFNQAYHKGLKFRVIRAWYRMVNRRSISSVAKVYGVTPLRKRYAEDYFHINKRKTDVLIMGADDEKLDFANRQAIRDKIREKYGVGDKDFLIVTGGKIDSGKNIHLLIRACADLSRVKLLIFGNAAESFKKEFAEIVASATNAIHIGWVDSDKVYDYFFAADLVAFPGTHSVLWEQACASKCPCLFKEWDGMDHVNNGGNSAFVSDVTVESLCAKIKDLQYTSAYHDMKKVAESNATDIYLYSHIAEKSVECVDLT